MNNIFKSKLGMYIFKSLIKSICIAIILFVTMYLLNTALTYQMENNYEEKMDIITNDMMNDFNDFVIKENITSKDTKAIAKWSEKYSDLDFVIIKDNNIIYSSEIDLEYIVFKTDAKNLDIDGDDVERLFNVNFTDGNGICVIKEDYDYILWGILNIISAMICILIFDITFLKSLNKKIDYIKEIEEGIYILESGDLDYIMPIKDNDEISSLANSINNMSDSMKDRINGELKAQEANKTLITNISHDIRTPLTPIIGYLTILIENENLTKEQGDNYLNIILSKANQLKDRANLLFEYSLLYSDTKDMNFNLVNANDLFEQIFFENTQILKKYDFDVNYMSNMDEGINIYIDVNQINRVMDNLISNIIKYADNKFIIDIKIYNKDEFVFIDIKNNTSKDIEGVESTGLGINISKSIIKLHRGDFNIDTYDNIYEVHIKLPKK